VGQSAQSDASGHNHDAARRDTDGEPHRDDRGADDHDSAADHNHLYDRSSDYHHDEHDDDRATDDNDHVDRATDNDHDDYY
jgi:hypothetical protein